jgi:hypothetical protein
MQIESFDLIIDGLRDDSELIDIVNGMVWCEMETTYQIKPVHSSLVFELDGVGVWYDYGADYHFFTHQG